MPNPKHLAKLMEGVEEWNKWRKQKPKIEPNLGGANLYEADLIQANLSGANLIKANLIAADLSKADLSKADLSGADLGGANLSSADLSKANLGGADLSKADLSKANLGGADLIGAGLKQAKLIEANLSNADLSEANLSEADLRKADLSGVSLSGAHLIKSDLRWVNLSGVNLSGAYLTGAGLSGANLSCAKLIDAKLMHANLSEAKLVDANLGMAKLGMANLTKADLSLANLTGANLGRATLVETNLEGADLTGCSVYGISVWNTRLGGAKQSNLLITHEKEPAIQVDNLEVAQFIYLLLNNANIRDVIDTITSKVVLILGRFTPERKKVLDAIREKLHKREYVPVLFDFETPASKNRTETITTLAKMARFIIADLTDPSSVPHELAVIAPTTRVPVQTVLLEGQREYAMFHDLVTMYQWVLEPYQYKSLEVLLAQLNEQVIVPAEAKARQLRPE